MHFHLVFSPIRLLLGLLGSIYAVFGMSSSGPAFTALGL